MKPIYMYGIIGILIIAISVSGCTTSEETEVGTATYNILTGDSILDVDYYTDEGTHVTGNGIMSNGNGSITHVGHVDRYSPNGQHVTGTWTTRQTFYKHTVVEETTYYNLRMAAIEGYYGAVMVGYEHEGAEWKIIK